MLHDVPANPLAKPGYRLDWHDEFDGADLDITKWLPYYLPHWSSRQRSAPRYALRDGTLVLQIDAEQQPWCPEFDGGIKASSIQTGLFAGQVGSRLGQLRFNPALVVREAQTNVQLYTPQYGYFECRAKASAALDTHVSLWMIGYEDTPDKSGEICMFEVFGQDVRADAATVRYGIHPWGDAALSEAFYHHPLAIDATAFHMYALEWTPTNVVFFVDNQPIGRIPQAPAYPMQVMLAIFERPAAAASPAYPKEFVVDYVRAYQPQAGY